MGIAATMIGTIAGLLFAAALLWLGGPLWSAALGHVMAGAVMTVALAASWPFRPARARA